jgi:hypothetical protein
MDIPHFPKEILHPFLSKISNGFLMLKGIVHDVCHAILKGIAYYFKGILHT